VVESGGVGGAINLYHAFVYLSGTVNIAVRSSHSAIGVNYSELGIDVGTTVTVTGSNVYALIYVIYNSRFWSNGAISVNVNTSSGLGLIYIGHSSSGDVNSASFSGSNTGRKFYLDYGAILWATGGQGAKGVNIPGTIAGVAYNGGLCV
jgi:hypothetical protein